jgi:putative SOS response-associated peptidase YedK
MVMCGRYTPHAEAEELMKRFGIVQLKIPVAQRYNIAPSHIVPALTFERGAKRPGRYTSSKREIQQTDSAFAVRYFSELNLILVSQLGNNFQFPMA